MSSRLAFERAMASRRTLLGLNALVLSLSDVCAFHRAYSGSRVSGDGTLLSRGGTTVGAAGRSSIPALGSAQSAGLGFDIGEWFRNTFMPQMKPPAEQER